MDRPLQTRFGGLRLAGTLFLAVLQLSCGDASAPPVPTDIVVEGGDGQEAVVATALPAPLVVRVTDGEGRPISGVVVAWSTSAAGGSFAPASSETDAQGRASTVWTLGTEAGAVTARASVARLSPASVRATARAGAVGEVVAASGDGQHAEVGEPLPELLRIRADDAWGNPVAGAAVTWFAEAGTLDDIQSVTGSDGSASARWTLGREPGPAEVTAQVAVGSGGTTSDVRFSSVADPTTLNLTVANAYLVQSVQRWDGDVPLVAGKAGLLRVFVEASRMTAQRPDVRVEVRDAGGALLADEIIVPPAGFALGPGVSETPANASYNLTFQRTWMSPGVRISASVDSGDRVAETDESDNGGAGGDLTPVVMAVPPLEVTIVPVRVNGDVGSTASPELLLWDVGRLFPLDEIDIEVRADTLDVGGLDLRSAEDFPKVLAHVDAARAADGSARSYYGILPYVEGAAWGGMGLIGRGVAVGLQGESMLAAHELGHTFGRQHPPCGSAAGPDPDFPYPEAATGVFGFDLLNSLVQPADRTDIMSYSYCGDRHWISDYTYEGVMDFRATDAAAAPVAAPPQPSLVVWGRVEGDSLVLEPAFRTVAPPSLPAGPGPYRLQGVAESGARVFDLSFRPTPVADAPGGTAVFAFVVPLDASEAMASIRFSDGLRATERRPAAEAGSPVRVEQVDDDRVRLRWDAARLPLVVVRDGETGRVLAFARGGDAEVTARSGRALELVASTGVDGRVVASIRR